MKPSPILFIYLLTISSLRAEDAESLFVRRVWPLFQEKCLACHGEEPAKLKVNSATIMFYNSNAWGIIKKLLQQGFL